MSYAFGRIFLRFSSAFGRNFLRIPYGFHKIVLGQSRKFLGNSWDIPRHLAGISKDIPNSYAFRRIVLGNSENFLGICCEMPRHLVGISSDILGNHKNFFQHIWIFKDKEILGISKHSKGVPFGGTLWGTFGYV